MTILVTGGAGFIGSSLVDKLLYLGYDVISIDNFDKFYDRSIKEENIKTHYKFPNFIFYELDIRNKSELNTTLSKKKIDVIVHLAAKAGVRPSIIDPQGYDETNVRGTINLLQFAEKNKIRKFILASSSSVYGINKNIPWSESDHDLLPISPYAASKISAENYAKVYAELYGLHVVALRFFTVFGPKQRPDLAIHKFFRLIYENKAIPFYGDGSTSRDYTFIDDITEGIIGAINKSRDTEGFEVFNLGNSNPVSLSVLVESISKVIGKKVILDKLPLQEGDVSSTFSRIEQAKIKLSYDPKMALIQGLSIFNEWFKLKNNLS